MKRWNCDDDISCNECKYFWYRWFNVVLCRTEEYEDCSMMSSLFLFYSEEKLCFLKVKRNKNKYQWHGIVCVEMVFAKIKRHNYGANCILTNCICHPIARRNWIYNFYSNLYFIFKFFLYYKFRTDFSIEEYIEFRITNSYTTYVWIWICNVSEHKKKILPNFLAKLHYEGVLKFSWREEYCENHLF